MKKKVTATEVSKNNSGVMLALHLIENSKFKKCRRTGKAPAGVILPGDWYEATLTIPNHKEALVFIDSEAYDDLKSFLDRLNATRSELEKMTG